MTGKLAARVNVTVEILRVERNQPPLVLHTLKHASHSLDMVYNSVEAVIGSYWVPAGANAFRIITDDGSEIYRWPSSRT